MRPAVVVRAALALLCAAGVVVSVISYKSQRSLDQGFHRILIGQRDDRTEELLEESRTLNPDSRAEIGLARVALDERRDWESLIRRALEREPENPSLHAVHSELLGAAGRREESRRAYDRAAQLDPQLFPPRPGGGG